MLRQVSITCVRVGARGSAAPLALQLASLRTFAPASSPASTSAEWSPSLQAAAEHAVSARTVPTAVLGGSMAAGARTLGRWHALPMASSTPSCSSSPTSVSAPALAASIVSRMCVSAVSSASASPSALLARGGVRALAAQFPSPEELKRRIAEMRAEDAVKPLNVRADSERASSSQHPDCYPLPPRAPSLPPA